ncbi:MAG: hypothetical protein QOJ89_4411 [bacterium]|jgi:uncharacterized cupredoxin-like copper-binding protein
MMRRMLLLAAPAVAGGLIAGCGFNRGAAAKPPIAAAAKAPATAAKAPATAANAPLAAADGKITVTSTEYAFAPAAITATAGKLTITLDNKGTMVHELVVLKGDEAASALKVSGGRVSEKTAVGEVSETAAGAAKSSTITLKPGHYIIVCNVPGHYQDGMRGTLTVR